MLDKPSRRLIESHYITLEPDHHINFPGKLTLQPQYLITLSTHFIFDVLYILLIFFIKGVVSVMISLITTLNISEEKKREEREDTSDTIVENHSMRLQLLTYMASLSSQSHNNCL